MENTKITNNSYNNDNIDMFIKAIEDFKKTSVISLTLISQF